MKFPAPLCGGYSSCVTSYAEVWIEIGKYCAALLYDWVTSYAEVWIEIASALIRYEICFSHLLRGGVD